MRRKDREVTDPQEIEGILENNHVMRIAVADGEFPYILPLNYGYTKKDDRITLFFHCATEGRKVELLKGERTPVSVVIDGDHGLVTGPTACAYSYRYASIIGQGYATALNDMEEKKEALAIIMKKFEKDTEFTFPDAMVDRVNVYRIGLEKYTAKKHA